MLHKSAAFSGVLSHSCPTRRATRSVVLSHKISMPPACWPGESNSSSGQLSTQSSAKNTVESRNARCWCASCPRGKKEKHEAGYVCSMGADYPRNPWEKKRYLGNENYRRLYWRDPRVHIPQKKNCLEVRGPLVPYPTPEPAAFAPSDDRPCPFPFSIQPTSSALFQKELEANPKWFVCRHSSPT